MQTKLLLFNKTTCRAYICTRTSSKGKVDSFVSDKRLFILNVLSFDFKNKSDRSIALFLTKGSLVEEMAYGIGVMVSWFP